MQSEKAIAALNLFEDGYNCAQSVFSVFAEDYNLPDTTIKRIASCFGGGMRMGSTCGALTGALMVLGLAKGFDTYSPEAKTCIEEQTTILINRWKSEFGATDCREILGIDVSNPIARQKARDEGVFKQHCPNCVATAVMLVEALL